LINNLQAEKDALNVRLLEANIYKKNGSSKMNDLAMSNEDADEERFWLGGGNRELCMANVGCVESSVPIRIPHL